LHGNAPNIRFASANQVLDSEEMEIPWRATRSHRREIGAAAGTGDTSEKRNGHVPGRPRVNIFRCLAFSMSIYLTLYSAFWHCWAPPLVYFVPSLGARVDRSPKRGERVCVSAAVGLEIQICLNGIESRSRHHQHMFHM
jgi:hypothetical protein